MQDRLSMALAQRAWLLADGATGTELFNLGLSSREPAELWNDTHRAEVCALHERMIASGADLILTNSYGGNVARLDEHGLGARCEELNRQSAEIARAAADASGRDVIVAGSVGPTGEIIAPLGPMSRDEAIANFAPQMAGLKAGGVDVIWLETFASLGELQAAAQAASAVGLPYAAMMNFDTGGRSMMGDTPAQMVHQLRKLKEPPVAIGANCGVSFGALLRSIQEFKSSGTDLALIAKGNAGIPMMDGHGHIHYDGTPEQMALYARLARDLGAKIIGGCCGTSPEHLAAMRQALEEHPPLNDQAAIEALIASFNASPSGRRK